MQPSPLLHYLGGKYLTGCTLYVTLSLARCVRFVLSQISKLCMEPVMKIAVL
jgi:hypothetical protein